MNSLNRILIVDDQADNAYYLRALLAGHGYAVDVARHGAEALVKARLAPPDLLISNLLMPVMDGYTLLQLWKADARLQPVPFIVYAATGAGLEDERLALALGADAFIPKPAGPEDFLSRIRAVQNNAAAGQPAPPKFSGAGEQELLKVYGETRIRKLEAKTLQLEETNRALRRDLAERGKLEAEVAVREQRLNAFFTSAPAGLVLLDKQLRYVQLNETVARINGIPLPDHLGKTIRELLPKLAPAAEPLLQQVLATGEPALNVEISGETPSRPGVLRHWMESIFPIPDQDGRPEGVGVIFVEITERKQAEAALRESEEKFSKLFQSSPIAMALSTLDEGRYLNANEEFLRILQASREQVIGHTATELGVWAKPDQRAVYMARLKEQGALRNIELEIRGQAGQVTPILWSAEPVTIGGENCLLGSSLDISERKRAENDVVASNEKFHQLAQNITDVFWVRSPDMSEVQYVSPAFERIWGRPVDQLYANPKQWVDYILPADRERVTAAFTRLTDESKGLDIEYRIVRPDGQVRWIRVRGFPVRDAAGQLVRHIGIVTDITERKLAEEELHWKTAFLEAQVDSSADGILVVDNQGKILLQNQRLSDLWKIPPELVKNKHDASQLEFLTRRTKNPRQFAAKIADLSSHPDEVSRDEIELVDGTVLDRYSSPVRDLAGTHYGRIWTFRDITQQRKLEAQFRQSQKMEAFGQLAGGVAHDFNNILAVIQLQAGLLQSERNLSLQQLDHAGEIEKAAQRAANLTRQLLLFSRQQTMQTHDLNLREVVDSIAKMLQRTLGEHIELHFKMPAAPLFIHADPGMMDQILLNLTVNARDAMPKGGQIIVEAAAVEFDEAAAAQSDHARPGAFVCLSVSDTGTGIPPEIMPRIFEPFFTTKAVGKGTGLGLATVFGIVHQHKGWLHVYSEVGRGTIFRVYLPRLTRAPEKTAVWASLASARGGHETILLVEDELALRASVRKILSHLGYRVIEAINGADALDVWQKNRAEIRLLLTDLVMPGGMTGKELAERLLAQAPGLKVIYTSGYSAEIVGKDFVLEEGVNFLSKPFESHKLAETVRNRLDEK
ncbi:MAG: PAS domain S-box protein [Verrucomicrobiae bacterium]|nr:PAS domain S-box protein [Verrucomicrobiae bacterium]